MSLNGLGNFGIESTDDYENSVVDIKVVGVGGGGNNAIDGMIKDGIGGVKFIAVNTDQQAMRFSNADVKLQAGAKLTKGQGAGSDPEVGRKAAEETAEEIAKALEGTEMVFIAAGMGGGTGTGAAPVVAQIAKSMGILTVGVVTKPFSFEGKKRMAQAEMGIENLSKHVDSLLVIPNDRLKLIPSEEKLTFKNAFKVADSVLMRAVTSILDLIIKSGHINLDFADVKSVMLDAGYAHMGVGVGKGKNKMNDAVISAIESPLLESSVKGAMSILVNVTMSEDTDLDAVEDAVEIIRGLLDDEAHVIFGAFIDEELEDEVKVAVIATGFPDELHIEEEVIEEVEEVKPVKEAGHRDSFDDIIAMFNRKN